MTPQAMIALQMKFTTLMLESQTVMALRMMAMSGVIPAEPGENARMLSEKGPAMADAFAAATDAMLRGLAPEQIINASMIPVSSKVRSNHRRLTR